jgi:hypothetical protein
METKKEKIKQAENSTAACKNRNLFTPIKIKKRLFSDLQPRSRLKPTLTSRRN